MKQITFKELKEICGCETNNEFANKLSLFMDDASELANNRSYEVTGKLYRKESNKIYAKLKELGYYDDLEEM